jgi:K+-sensing histidine kinase KdpD
MKQFLGQISRPAAGIVLCVGLALLVATFASSRPWRSFVPLVFAIVIILLAARYGLSVAIIGSVAATVIFAMILYKPLGSIRVADQSEKSALGWMLLGSIALSYLLLPPKPEDHSRHSNQHR